MVVGDGGGYYPVYGRATIQRKIAITGNYDENPRFMSRNS